MCTKEETKLFIETVNSIPTREMPHLDIEFFDEADFIDQFPVKDRSTSRNRHHASKRDKAKHYNRNLNKKMRDERISRSGFNYSKGKSHNQDSLEYLSSLDMELYNKNSNNGNETINPTDTDKEQLANCFLSVKFPDSNPYIATDELLDELKTLSDKGIEISSEVRETLFSSLIKRERKLKIDNERPIVAYSIYRYDYPDDPCFGTYPTREMAEESKIYLSAMFPEYEQDYYILPVYTYTEEQVREIKELGFIPAVGFVEPGIKWNSCDFHA